MPEYRLYCLSGDGHFSKSQEIEASSDEEALEKARGMQMATKCELWERGRLVGKLDSYKA